jgi:hypothetical protein
VVLVGSGESDGRVVVQVVSDVRCLWVVVQVVTNVRWLWVVRVVGQVVTNVRW